MTLYILTAILFLTQLGDWYTTRTILSKGGVELNPVAKKLMDEFGMDVALSLKTILVTAAGYWIGSQEVWLLVAVILFYVFVLIYNWRSMPK